jgi:hypothetical protein
MSRNVVSLLLLCFSFASFLNPKNQTFQGLGAMRVLASGFHHHKPLGKHNPRIEPEDIMESLLVKLMLFTALTQLGISLSRFENCHSRSCIQEVEKRSRDILRIEWKPISLFPEEARRF